MSECKTLLPPSATRRERVMEQALCRMVAIDSPIASLWDADACPAHLLPWLAWALGVDGWEADLSLTGKRALIKETMGLKRIIGTEQSVQTALAAAGFPGIKIVEANQDADQYNGFIHYNGLAQHGYGGHWAQYWLIMTAPIANHLVPVVQRIARRYAPARCQLVQLVYNSVAHSHNSAIVYDGSYNYGAA